MTTGDKAMWTHNHKNILATQMKRLAKRHRAHICRSINYCGRSKEQFLELACLLIDTCSDSGRYPINDRKNFYVLEFAARYPFRRNQFICAQKFSTRKNLS